MNFYDKKIDSKTEASLYIQKIKGGGRVETCTMADSKGSSVNLKGTQKKERRSSILKTTREPLQVIFLEKLFSDFRRVNISFQF